MSAKYDLDRKAAAALTLLSAKFHRERECYEHSEAEATALRRKLEEARKALQTALVAMKLAAALPGVSDEYDFDPAIDAVTRALTSGGDNG